MKPSNQGAAFEVSEKQTGTPKTVRRIFQVDGLDCAEEVSVLRREVGPLVSGADNLTFDILNGRMIVLETVASVSDEDIMNAVLKTGMSAQKVDDKTVRDGSDHKYFQSQKFFTTASGVCWIFGIGLHFWTAGGFEAALKLFAGHGVQPMPLFEGLAYILAILLGGRFVAIKAWYALRRLRPDMNLLMVIAVLGALFIGEWFEAATVAFLFSLSLLLESWSVGRARRAVSALLDLTPPMVRIRLEGGSEKDVLAATIETGTHFVVRPGDRLPLDGVVVTGTSSVNQAPITGESVPVLKEPGDEVFAGTINGDGALEIKCSKRADQTLLAGIIRLVSEAHNARANVEQWVERFARIYTPAVMALAIAIFAVPTLAFGGAWDVWLYNALVLLVIACPCALVISTPVSIVAALASSARQGVLIKGGAYLELPARLKAIAMDKTGTLTKGEPEVVGVIALNQHSEEELLERAAGLEAHSSHPLAKAILDYANKHSISFVPAEQIKVLPGKGVAGRFKKQPFWLGSNRFLEERGQGTPEVFKHAQALEKDGKTVVAIGNDGHVCGLIALADSMRPDAREIVSDLHSLGIEHVVMLTGDNQQTAQAIGTEVGIDEIKAELLPEDKVAALEALARKYGVVAMVGDGVNDAPAMARADIGIAMGAIGSDAAIETADIALMSDDLSRVPWLIAHARRTLFIIHQNIFFSLGVKVVFVVLTVSGFATMWGAITADVGASLLVVINALRLLRAKPLPTRSALQSASCFDGIKTAL